MPIPAQRDVDQSAKQLAAWLAPRVDADGDLLLSPFRGPGATGFSNETLIVDGTWSCGGQPQQATWVVRVAPSGYTLFPDAAFEVQHTLLKTLATQTSIPVPNVRWYETDPAVLGAPFFVMDEVQGVVPPDNPPYHVSGWLHDVTPEVRERIWWGAIDTMAELHTLDWRALGLGFLDKPELGTPGLGQQLSYYERFLESVEKDEQVPMARRALAWLKDNLPAEEPLVLCWGDARVGNVMYDDNGNRLAVLDWEMVSLGSPSQDVAWAWFLDRHHCEGMEVPRLAGFPSKEETIARYQARSGRILDNFDFYEVFAGFRFCVIMARLAVIFKDWGLLPAADGMAQENAVTRVTARVLEERGC
ncbi:MAG: aminoglycoside phosphotransferase [Frankiales bacterium]|nr:aminoglycoside phosphotransferase [Frankiales bacterium]